MRYAIFSDVHANRQAWEAVRADMERMGAETLVCLGDVVGYGPMPQEVLAAVREATPNFVLGNHDAAACGRLDASIFNERARRVIEWTRERLDEESLRFLQEVPLQMDGGGVQFVHAEVVEPGEFGYIDGPGQAALNLRAMTQRLGFIGHTHLPMAFTMAGKDGPVRQLPPIDFEIERGNRYLVNVGSVGEPRTTDVRASYVIYDDVEGRIVYRKIVFDVEGYRDDLDRTGLDIRPYFVQVVDADKAMGEPVPAAAPQMALVQLPKVAEVVAGHHGRLVVGQPGAAWGSGGAQTAVAQPKSMPVWMVGLLAVLVLVVVGAVALVVSKRGGRVAGDESGAEEVVMAANRAPASGAGDASAARAPAGAGAALAFGELTVRLFAGDFDGLEALRAADDRREEAGEAEVPDGLIGLDAGRGQEAFGLVWEGELEVRQTGMFVFSLAADSEAALLIMGEAVLKVAEPSSGAPVTAEVWLARGDPPIRLEYIHRSGEPRIDLHWQRALRAERHSLVRRAPLAEPPRIVKASREAPPAPAAPAPAKVQPTAPAKLAQDLLAYWSFDNRERAASRFAQLPDGSVVENLISFESQRVRILAPERDIGSRWRNLEFDDGDWQEGLNGVGYEDRPGGYAPFIKTTVGGTPKRRPHSVYIRIPFEVEDPEAYKKMVLSMRCGDGFVAYLNGSQMASKNLLDPPVRWNFAAKNSIGVQEAVTPELFKVDGSRKYLKKGGNILAIHGLNSGGQPDDTNRSSTSTDMLIQARLVALRKDNAMPEGADDDEPSPHDRAVDPADLEGAVTETGGRFGEAYQFKEGSIEIGGRDEFAIGDGSFSLSLWFTREPDSADHEARRLISAGGGSDTKAGWALWISRKTDALTFVVGDGSSRPAITAKEESLASGEWRHAAVTVDRDNETVRLFLDGQVVDEQRVPLLKAGPIASNSGLAIGRNSDDAQHHRGKLDDLGLWRRVLLPSEVEAIFESERSLGEVFLEQDE